MPDLGKRPPASPASRILFGKSGVSELKDRLIARLEAHYLDEFSPEGPADEGS